MELKNLFTKEAQNTYSAVTGGIKKKIKPVIDMGSELVRQNVEAIQPAVSSIKDTVKTFSDPIIKPIQKERQKIQAIGEINTFFNDAGITLDDIKALAEDEGLDPNEVITKFKRNGIKVQGMEELQAQEEANVAEEVNKPFALDINPKYDEVTALSGLTGAIPKYEYSPEDSMLKSTGKMIGNLPVSGIQMAGAVGDIGLSYLRNLDQGPVDAFTETAKAKIINPTIAQAYGIKDIAQEGYKEGGVLGATSNLLEKGSEFIVENPVGAIMTGKSLGGAKRGLQAIKTAGQEGMKGNIGTATTGLIKSTGIGLKENIYDPIKMGVTAPLTVAKLGAKGIGAIAKKTETGKGIAKKVENAKTRLAGIDENEIGALEKTSPSEIDAILKQAEQTKGKQGDYVQTPYHVGAEKAKKTLNKLDTDLKTRQSERIAILDESPITKIDATDARTTLKDSLRSMNVEDIQIVDGTPKIIPVKGREALLDLSNPADVKALQKLNEILDGDVSPTQTMDRVKKLQEWAYENKSTIGVKGTSERMDGLIKRVQGSLNSTFKKQLPEEYAKVLDSMSEDIKLSNEIKRVFGIDDAGNPVGNRGELVMKRLANGTTTGGEARTIAKQIFDRYGIDLIKEARLRQMAMDLVGDARGQTLFGVIKGGKQGIIDKAIEYTVGKIVNKEKLLRGIAKGKGEQVKNTEPIYMPNAFRKAMSEEAKKPIGLPAPTGKATGAKNVRVNQPIEKSPIKNEGQVGVRPGTKPIVTPKNDTPIIKKPIVNTDKNTNYVGRKDLIGKLSPEDAVIQSGIDSGWLGITGGTSLKDLNPRQRKYLYDSATSAFFSNDPVFTQRINAYTRPSKPIVKPNTIKNESKVTEPVVVPKKIENTPIVKKSSVESKVDGVFPASSKNGSKLEWNPKMKTPQDIFYLDRNGIRQTEFEGKGVAIKGNRTGYTMDEYLKNNGLSKSDFTLLEGTKGEDGLYILNDKGNKKLLNIKSQNVKQSLSKPISSDTIPKGIPKVIEKPEIIKKIEIETLPEDVNVYDEAKRVGAKRISPDRVAHQKLTPEEGIQGIIDKKKANALRNSEGFAKMSKQVDELQKKYGEKMPTRLQAEKLNSPTINEDRRIWSNIETNSSAKNFNDAKVTLDRRSNMWKGYLETPDYYKVSSQKEYIDLIKDDISKGYKYPDEVIKYDPSFSKAVTSRERYEKGLNTSFGADDSRIVFDEVDSIGAGMKRQDGKIITPEQKTEIISGVKDFSDALGLDMKKLAEKERWVYVHLNGKNPFLMKDIAGLYRKDAKNKSVSISVGGTETFDKLDIYGRVMKDAEGKVIREKANTTVAHELGHAIDYLLGNKLFDRFTINKLTESMNRNTPEFKSNRKYYTKKEEVVARMIEQYVAESKGHTGIRQQTAQWSKEIFDNEIKPLVESAIKENFPEFIKPKKIFSTEIPEGIPVNNPLVEEARRKKLLKK